MTDQNRFIINNKDNLVPVHVGEKTAFGELSVAGLSPQIHGDFSYNINADIFHKHQNGGTEGVDSHRLKITTTAAAIIPGITNLLPPAARHTTGRTPRCSRCKPYDGSPRERTWR